MPEQWKYKYHYEEEPGKPVCSSKTVQFATSDPEKVTCAVCKRILVAQRPAMHPITGKPFKKLPY